MTDTSTETGMWLCIVCGYIYDPDMGDPTQAIDPDTSFEDLPDDWMCPLCYVDKTEFEPY